MFTRKKFFLRNESTEVVAGGGLYDQAPAGTPPAASQTPPAPTATWDSENWKDLLDEDIKGDPSLKAIKDPKSLAKSYVHAQKMIGADKIVLPNQYTTPEEWENVYAKLGRPEAADKYDIKFDEETPVSEEFTNNLKASMFKAGLNSNQASQVANFWQEQVKTSIKNIEAQTQAQINEELGGLKQEWGQAYNGKIKAAEAAISTFGGKEMFAYLQEKGLHTDTKLARLFAAVGESLVEDGTVVDINKDDLMAPMDIEREIKENMAKPAYYDSNFPEHKILVARTAELFKKKAIK